MEESAVSTVGPKSTSKRKGVLVALITVLLLCLLAGGLYAAYVFGTNNAKVIEAVNNSDNTQNDNTDACPKCEECPTCGTTTNTETKTVTAFKGYTLSVGSKTKVTVPDGWYVSKIISAATDLTDAEKKEHIKPTEVNPDYLGIWPIHTRSYLELTNGKSYIMFNHTSQFMAYGWGMEMECAEALSEKYFTVSKPTKDKSGLIRYMQDSGIYEYQEVEIVDEAMGGSCKDNYGYVSGNPFGISYTFHGDNKDLPVADTLMTKQILGAEEFSFGE